MHKSPEEIAELKIQLLWHLDTAKKLAEELQQEIVSGMIELVVDAVRKTDN